MAARIPARLSAEEGRKFGVTVGAALLALAGVDWWRGHGASAQALGALGGLLILAGLLVPAQLGPVERAWMGLSHAISRITTPVFLAVVYFLVITPTGIAMRLAGRHTLRPRATPGGGFWAARDPESRSRRDMERQF